MRREQQIRVRIRKVARYRNKYIRGIQNGVIREPPSRQIYI